MATFQAQVEGLTSISVGTTPTTGELTQFLVDGVNEVTNRIISIRPDEIGKFTTSTNDAADAGVTITGKVLSVVREHDSTTILRPCSPIDPTDRYLAADVNSLKFRSKYNPGFYQLDGKIHTVPISAGGNNDAIVTQVGYDGTIAFGSSAIVDFPDEYEYLVVLYASLKSIQAVLGAKSLPSDIVLAVPPDSPDLDDVTFSVTNALVISATEPTAISLTTVNYNAVSATATTALSSLTAPTYGKGTSAASQMVAFNDFWTLGDFGDSDPGVLTISATPPSSITLTPRSVVALGTAPLYTAPTQTISGTAWATAYPDQYSTVATALTAIATEIGLANAAADVAPVPPEIPDIGAISYSAPANTDVAAVGGVTVTAVTFPSGDIPSYANISAYEPGGVPDLSANAFSQTTNILALSAETYGEFKVPDAIVVPAAILAGISISSPGINNTEKGDISGDVPTYTKPGHPSQVTFSAYSSGLSELDPGALSITAVVPDTPDVPDFTDPTIAGVTVSGPNVTGGTFPDADTLAATDISALFEITGAGPTFDGTVIDSFLTEMNNFIDTDQDVELASAKGQEIQIRMQEELHEFNEKSVTFQAEVQNAQAQAQLNAARLQAQAQLNTQVDQAQAANTLSINQADAAMVAQKNQSQAQIDSQKAQQEASMKLQKEQQEYASTLQRFSAELQVYTAEVNAEVQAYSQSLAQYQLEINLKFQAWSKTESDNLQVFQLDIQNELNEFNKDNVKYQANVQAELAKFQVDAQEAQKEGDLIYQAAVQDYSSKLQKFQADLSSYQAAVNTEVQEYTHRLAKYNQELQRDLTVWQREQADEISEYGQKVSRFQSQMQDELNTFNSSNVNFQAKFQEAVQEAQDANQVALQNMQKDLAIAQSDAQLDNARLLQDAIQTTQATISNNSALIQKFQGELSQYQAETSTMSAIVQGYINTAQGYIGEVQARLSNVAPKVSEYQAQMQNALNVFNDANIEYQADLQVKVQNAQMADADQGRQLAQYQAEVTKYQAQVNDEVQEYSQKLARYQLELNTVYQAWGKTESDRLSALQIDVQEELSEFNKENASFQYEVQKALADASATNQIALQNGVQEARDAIENNNVNIARFQAMAAHYSAQVNEDVQKYTAQLQADVQAMQATIANNQSKLNNYQANTAAYQAETSAELQRYQAELQGKQLDYQWLENRYGQLKAEYDGAFIAISPPRQAEGSERARA